MAQEGLAFTCAVGESLFPFLPFHFLFQAHLSLLPPPPPCPPFTPSLLHSSSQEGERNLKIGQEKYSCPAGVFGCWAGALRSQLANRQTNKQKNHPGNRSQSASYPPAPPLTYQLAIGDLQLQILDFFLPR